MALDLAGITNLEFYSPHYLDAVLETDLRDVFRKWKEAKDEQGTRQPHERLNSLGNAYFQALGQAEGERDPVRRWEIAREFHVAFLGVLGYPYKPEAALLDDNSVCPVLLSLERDGNPFLWVVDAPYVEDEDDDPLGATPYPEQLPKENQDDPLPRNESKDLSTWREILDNQIFHSDKAPRWILFLAGSEILLIERNKWPQGRYLRFELTEIFSRRQTNTLKAVAGLLHKDSLAPDAGICLHDTLDENSHKHAYAVSTDLKYGVRRAVELIGNEAVWYRREVQRQAVFDEDVFPPEQLTSECLTFLYRLLFLFYIEARGGDLGIVPMDAEVYRDGYSLETLRNLELVPLTTQRARNGYYIHDSLRTLFRIINDGYPTKQGPGQTVDIDDSYHDSMRIDAMNSPLFDIDRLETIKNVRFRNVVMQEVLQLLSLSAEKGRRARGRISYAQLGINQLGAVYESILSYTGFFAHEDLYEVASEKDCKKLSGKPPAERESLKTYFVPASKIADYKDTEIVKDSEDRKIVHKKGSFIFRLAGRNREKSASYYTPEVLTQCLVKYALKELLWEEGEEGARPTLKKTADEILALTICEPAMGSSAFLIEAVDQLADAYLEARQEEVKASGGETIPPEDYQREKRRVKARLATNNCYGVDLNPTAVELAKVSLWLATLHEDGKCPWFGLRLATGNSLVGARREVFKAADVIRKGTKDAPNWLSLVPEPVPLHHSPEEGGDAPSPDEVDWANWTAPPRPKGTIYHFLLPAEGMAAFDKDKVIKQLAPESVKRIKEWRKEFCKPFSKKDAERLEQISDAVDRLFAQVVRERVLATQETSDRIPVWGEPPSAQQADLLVRDQEEVAASLEDGSSAYRRLKLAMDAWCALWFWPIEEAGLLPDRATWLAQMELILKGQVTYEPSYEQGNLFAELVPSAQGVQETRESGAVSMASQSEDGAGRTKLLQTLSDAFRDRRAEYLGSCGLADVDALLDQSASLRAAQTISDRLRFLHWELRFAEVLARRAGFDLALGNPPWVRADWEDEFFFGDHDPLLAIRSIRGGARSSRKNAVLEASHSRDSYLQDLSASVGLQAYLGSTSNYEPLAGVRSNLYKLFVVRGFRICSTGSVLALLHDEGMFDDPRGGALREQVYLRLRSHFQFWNYEKFFEDVRPHQKFSINVYVNPRQDSPPTAFRSIFNLFHPSTVESCLQHDGLGAVPGLHDEQGDRILRGHRDRVVMIKAPELELFNALYEDDVANPSRAKLPLLHSTADLRLLRLFANLPHKVRDFGDQFAGTTQWNETTAQREGWIERDTRWPRQLDELVVQGAHFYVGNPIAKTPNDGCKSKHDYSRIDMTAIEPGFLPRTNYVPAVPRGRYRAKMPTFQSRPVVDFYRHVHRETLSRTSERSVIGSLLPPGPAHLYTAYTVLFDDPQLLVSFSCLFSSLPYDFFVLSTGRDHANKDLVSCIPLPELDPDVEALLCSRWLRLNCVTEHYSDLWSGFALLPGDSLCREDARFPAVLSPNREWNRNSPLRSDFLRYQALVEIDTLSAIAVSMSLDDLTHLYESRYKALKAADTATAYDQLGRSVPLQKTIAGLPAISLIELAATLKEQAGFDVHAEYHPDGSNTQELRKQKIRLGKKEADVLGVSERCTMADLLAETEVRWSDEDHPEGRPVRLVGLRYTDPGLEPRMERVYPTPWTRCNREADYRQAWAEFERRLGKKMPEGTPL